MNSSHKLPAIAVIVLMTLGFQHFAVAEEPSTTPPVSKDKAVLMKGTWLVTTVGKSAHTSSGQKADVFNQTFELECDGKEFKGKPFGFTITKSSVSTAAAGGNVAFGTTYTIMNQDCRISWQGKMSADGTEISDGLFSLMIGKGTFTARKKEVQ